jgi:hypothetical protein
MSLLATRPDFRVENLRKAREAKAKKAKEDLEEKENEQKRAAIPAILPPGPPPPGRANKTMESFLPAGNSNEESISGSGEEESELDQVVPPRKSVRFSPATSFSTRKRQRELSDILDGNMFRQHKRPRRPETKVPQTTSTQALPLTPQTALQVSVAAPVPKVESDDGWFSSPASKVGLQICGGLALFFITCAGKTYQPMPPPGLKNQQPNQPPPSMSHQPAQTHASSIPAGGFSPWQR